MRGLTILQPYAGLLAAGLKVNAVGEIIEFRNRETHIRERVAIRAGTTPANWRDPSLRSVPTLSTETVATRLEAAKLCSPLGAVLCLATLSDCRPVETADVTCPGCPDPASEEWAGTWAWIFTGLIALPEPVPCEMPRGARTWFMLPEDAEAKVRAQIGGER